MKKYIIPLFMFIFSFILAGNVNAKTYNVTINFDVNEKFNYFYEQKNNTPFFNYLVGLGSDIYDELGSYVNSEFSSSNNPIFLYHYDEIANLLNSTKVPDNAYYVINIYSPLNPNSSFYKNFYIGNSGSEFYYELQTAEHEYFKGFYLSGFLFFYDSNANLLAYGSLDKFTGGPTGKSYYDKFDFSKIDEFSYFISKYYTGKDLDFRNNPKSKVVVPFVHLEGQNYLIDDSTQYSGITKFFQQLGWFVTSFKKQPIYEVVDSNLKYFKDNPVISESSKMKSFYNAIGSSTEPTYPFDDSYSQVMLGDIDNGYYLIPKSTSGDFNIYFYSTNSVNELSVLVYDISTDTPVLLKDNLYFTPVDNRYLKLDLTSLFLDDNKTQIDLSSKYMFYLYSSNNSKYPLYIYYKTDVYDAVKTSISNRYHEFNNVNTGNNISFDTRSGYFDGKNVEEDLSKSNDSFNLDLSSITKMSKGLINNIVSCIVSIFSLVFEIFACLPAELQQLLYFSLFAGVLITIFKMIRGG